MNRSPYTVLAVCSIAVFLAALDATVLFVAFQDIHRSYPDATPGDLSWVINAYTIAYAALLVPAGRLADRYGRKRFFTSGVLLFTAASMACGLAHTAPMLVLARVLQALGAAALLPSSLALVLDAFPSERRASAVSLWSSVGGLAAALGPSVGSIVVERFGWEWVFFMNVPLGALALWLGRGLLTESRGAAARGVPDPAGILLLVGGMAAVAAAVVKGDDWGYRDGRTLLSASAGLCALGLFIARSRRVADPAIDLRLFADTRFLFANAAMFVFSVAFVVMFFGNIFFLTQQWHYTLQQAGLAITPGPATVVPFSLLAGRIADKYGHRALLLTGSALFALGGLWYVESVGSAPDFWRVWLPRAVLTGAAVGLLLPSLSGAAVANIPRQDSALGSAINQATRQFGSVIGVAIAVALLGQQDGASPPEAFTQSYSLMAVGGLLTGLLSLRLSRPAAAQASAVPRVAAG